MRLTCNTANGYCDMQIATRENKLDKLGQLEDIEEELGIDLLVLHKAISCGVFMLTKNFDIVYCEHPKLIHYKSGWKMLICGSNLSFPSYGKLWALTKEELL